MGPAPSLRRIGARRASHDGFDRHGVALLAILSACETGVSDYRDLADEYQGLAAAFRLAGAATVVPSLCSVSDLCTSLLMQRFHENLYQRHMAKAPALREAQRWLRAHVGFLDRFCSAGA